MQGVTGVRNCSLRSGHLAGGDSGADNLLTLSLIDACYAT
jgi:hypothetical protein